MPVKYGFFEQLKDFLNRGPKSLAAVVIVGIFIATLVFGGIMIPEMGAAVIILVFLGAVGWALSYMVEHWR